MTRRILFTCLMLTLAWLVRPQSILAEVGYVDILNGVEPAKAFVMERQGRTITPGSIQTNLEDGDVVTPLAEAQLWFTPTDTACEPVEISGEFTVTACLPPSGGLKDKVINYLENEIEAVPAVTVPNFVSRGSPDLRIHSLPPLALKVFVESSGLSGALKKTPFLALTTNKDEAEALILGQGDVQLFSSGGTEGRLFQLPDEEGALRLALLRRIHFKMMTELASSVAWPGVELSINVHAPAEGGAVDYDNRKWSMVKAVKVADGQPIPIPVTAPCLLTFSIANRSEKPYYAYLVNYTDEGQILSFLPPQENPQMSNLVPAGAELPVAGVFLELTEPLEFVRLILSENPMDLHPFSQKSLDEPAGQASSPIRLRPAPEKSWATLVQAFEMK